MKWVLIVFAFTSCIITGDKPEQDASGGRCESDQESKIVVIKTPDGVFRKIVCIDTQK